MKAIITLACGLLAMTMLAVNASRETTTYAGPQEQKAEASEYSQLEDLLDKFFERSEKRNAVLVEMLSQHSTELAAIEQCYREEVEAIHGKFVTFEQKLSEVEGKAESAASAAVAPKAEIEACQCDCAERLVRIEQRLKAIEDWKAQSAQGGSYPATSSGASSARGLGSSGSTMAGYGSSGTSVKASYGSSGSSVTASYSSPVQVQEIVVIPAPRTPVQNLARAVTAPIANAGHWSHDGEPIDFHLSTDHARELQAMGVNIQGMSREQMLSLHDSLHEGRMQPQHVARAPLFDFNPRPPLVSKAAASAGCPYGGRYVNGQWVCNTAPTMSRTVSNQGWYPGKALGLKR